MALVLEWDFEYYQEEELLVALHARFAPCKMAYWLNTSLHIGLKRERKDLYDKEFDTFFPFFSYEGEKKWYLITNKVRKEVSVGMFLQVEENQLLIKELPKVDYFLRITPLEEPLSATTLLKELRWIDFFYEIALFPEGKIPSKEQRKLNEIKSKLIF